MQPATIPNQIALAPGETVILPTKSLERVFIGLGWNNAISGEAVDLDCSIVGYDKDGVRDAANTVSFARLRNGAHKSQPSGSSIVHTGDILMGSKGNIDDAKDDMERIYVWLSELPDHLATIAFATDVYTEGLTFASLANAYCRLVNADTNQELARLTLTAQHLGPIASSRVMLLARIQRLVGSSGLWALESCAEPRAQTLASGTGPQADMLPIMMATPIADPAHVPVAIPVAEPIAPVVAQPVGGGGSGFGGGGGSSSGPGAPPTAQSQDRLKKRQGRAWGCPALAVGTTAGVAAATAIFMTNDASPLSASMLDEGIFTSGVDLGDLALPDMSGAADFFSEGLQGAGDAIAGAGEAVAGGLEGAGEALVGAADSAGDCCGGLLGGCCAGLCGDVQEKAGDVVGNAGDMASGAGEAITNAGEAVVETVKAVAEGVAGAMAEALDRS